MFIVDKIDNSSGRDNTSTRSCRPRRVWPRHRYLRGAVCWVTESVRNFYQLEYVHKTFTLELIESVLTYSSARSLSFHTISGSYSDLTNSSLCSSKRPASSPLLRSPSAAPALSSSYSSNLPPSSRPLPEVEVILTLLIKLIGGETDVGEPRPDR
ncbi:hypothetical protein BGY98DRAFT_1177834 [Russula aff. rugulosa BPL654]|nr:hypothetical protein BGY98DRAFT_1177834 [Russula aff. rugulosa BPL654]